MFQQLIILDILLLPHLLIEHNHIFKHMPELLASFLLIAFLPLPQCFDPYWRKLMEVSKNNDNRKTTKHCSRVCIKVLHNFALFINRIHQFQTFFITLHCLSMESISFELTILISSMISMVLFVHSDLTRCETPGLR